MPNTLELVNIHTFYGETMVLQGVSLSVPQNSIIALLGRNGMGKTTTLCSIVGLTPPRRGEVYFKGRNITHLSTHKIARIGIGLVQQGRHIFPSLSVKENLTMAARKAGKPESDAWTLERVYSLFPIIKEREKLKGTLLSGGEQQMLTISRTLMTNPDLLLMDEPSEGLAPIIVREIGSIIKQLRERGFSILLVEQNLSMALSVADYTYILSKGKIVYEATPDELASNEIIKNTYLGVS